MKDNFWNDETAKEFCEYAGLRIGKGVDIRQHVSLLIEDFKKSKEKDMPKEFDYDVLCWECKDGKDGYKRPCTVKRLTDNSVFNVGDETDKGKITMFTIQKDNLYVHIDHLWYYINHIQKVKPKVALFTTEDGVEIYYSKERIWQVYSNWCSGSIPIDILIDKKTAPDGVKFFSTSEKANEYILLNKPIEVSYKELSEYLEIRTTLYDGGLKDFFKSKINP